ncbi:MAG: hypothetical protein KBG02_14710 [Haliscomenobacter sp.]|nr:hypothetical protein [Haliscomenobacter sp.]MBP9078115.1 hypothetical protein [Haliscomenobacter sp.]
MNLTDWIGAAGVSVLLVAYVLSLRNILSKDGSAYAFLNFLGAALACLASVMLRYWPFIVLEAAWALVSLAALIQKTLGNR